MLKTAPELLRDLGDAVRARRIAQGWSQAEAAARAGMGARTWRRLENDGQATTAHLVAASLALRCEEHLAALFPPLPASSIDELLARQEEAVPAPRQRAPRRRPGA